MNIRDYLRVLVKWRKLIIWNVFIITSIALAISLLLKEKYTSRASLLPPIPGTEFLGGEISTLASFSGMRGALGMSTPSDLFAKILESERIKDKVIEECDLRKVYKTKTTMATYSMLDKETDISVSPEGIITIATTSESPLLAKYMADSYIKSLDAANKNLTMSVGKRNRIFLEHRLEEVNEKLKKSEDALKNFQETHKTISIQDEILPILESISELRAKILANEVNLGILRKYATEENPKVVNIKSELSELHKKLSAMEYTGDDSHFGVGFSIPFKEVPNIQLNLARLTRDVLIQQKLFELLTEQYEKAKLQEVRDTPTVNILEEARVPERKSYPRRKIIVLATFIISFAAGVILAFFLNWAEELPPDEKNKWQEIWSMWRKKRDN
ncbi:MAG: hypothetical protein COT09_03210 [Candidatus Hydromicrobium americanum]|nr:MAG: hypothetical protein COT09_03210 [Candidatus Hydromicrobium americanum]